MAPARKLSKQYHRGYKERLPSSSRSSTRSSYSTIRSNSSLHSELQISSPDVSSTTIANESEPTTVTATEDKTSVTTLSWDKRVLHCLSQVKNYLLPFIRRHVTNPPGRDSRHSIRFKAESETHRKRKVAKILNTALKCAPEDVVLRTAANFRSKTDTQHQHSRLRHSSSSNNTLNTTMPLSNDGFTSMGATSLDNIKSLPADPSDSETIELLPPNTYYTPSDSETLEIPLSPLYPPSEKSKSTVTKRSTVGTKTITEKGAPVEDNDNDGVSRKCRCPHCNKVFDRIFKREDDI